MELLLTAVAVLIGSGIAAWLLQSWPRVCTAVGATGAVMAAGLGIPSVWQVLAQISPKLAISSEWLVPAGHFGLRLDALAAWFLVPILILPALAAIFATEALSIRQPTRRRGPAVFLLNLLTAAMIVVVVADNGLLFLAAWEVAAIAASCLILLDHDRPEVQRAGWLSFAAGQSGFACLAGFFAFAGHHAGGSLQYADFMQITDLSRQSTGILFGLALAGFGISAGLVPAHARLPAAYSAASSHVSAVLSGVYSTLGFYGLLRVLSLLGAPPNWWSGLLIVIGLVSGLAGTVLALFQKDLKRLLACTSLQSLGVLQLGLGLGLLAYSQEKWFALTLGLTASLLHVWNHALGLGLLFLSSGIVELQTGTSNMDRLGGQIKRLPWTTGAFLVGILSICGLPPFNGFASKLVLYMSAVDFHRPFDSLDAIPGLAVVIGLAFISGLMIVVFTTAFGGSFLGNPRSSEAAAPAKKVGWRLRSPILFLGIGCYAVGLLASRIVGISHAVIYDCIQRTDPIGVKIVNLGIQKSWNGSAVWLLQNAGKVTSLFLLVVILLIALRWILLSRRGVAYTAGTVFDPASLAMGPQISSSGFDSRSTAPSNHFPPTGLGRTGLAPILSSARERIQALYQKLQALPVNLHVLSIAVTLVALLVWQLRWSR